MHRYRSSRPWSVAGLAAAATAATVLLTGAVSTTLPEPRPEYAEGLRQLPNLMIDKTHAPLAPPAQAAAATQ